MSYIYRDYSYSEKDDFRLHIFPLKKAGNRVEGIFICRNPSMVLTGWHVIEGANMNDFGDPGSGPAGLDPSQGFHGW